MIDYRKDYAGSSKRNLMLFNPILMQHTSLIGTHLTYSIENLIQVTTFEQKRFIIPAKTAV